MIRNSASQVVVSASGYLTDAEVREDLGGISQMTLNRMRKAGRYIQPVKFTPNGRNHTPREEHESCKARLAAAPRKVSDAKRKLGQELAARRAQKLAAARQTGRGFLEPVNC
jgi:hypothetical protein